VLFQVRFLLFLDYKSPGGPLLRRCSLKKVPDLLKVFDLLFHYMITACKESIAAIKTEKLWMVFASLSVSGPLRPIPGYNVPSIPSLRGSDYKDSAI